MLEGQEETCLCREKASTGRILNVIQSLQECKDN